MAARNHPFRTPDHGVLRDGKVERRRPDENGGASLRGDAGQTDGVLRGRFEQTHQHGHAFVYDFAATVNYVPLEFVRKAGTLAGAAQDKESGNAGVDRPIDESLEAGNIEFIGRQ